MSKIKHIEIKNALGIKEIDMDLGNINIIQGGNKQGKTSFLEAIEKGCANQNRRENFVRTGETEAFVKIDLDDNISIERTIKQNGKDRVKVTRDGFGITAQETFLKSILGSDVKRKNEIFSFNPVDFMQKTDKEQTEIILSLMPISVSDEDIEKWFDGLSFPVDTAQHGLKVLKQLERLFYDERKKMKAIAKESEENRDALLRQIPDNYDLGKWDKVSLMSYSDRIREAEKINANRAAANIFAEEFEQKVKSISDKFELERKQLEASDANSIKNAEKSVECAKEAIAKTINGYREQIKELERKIIQEQANLKAIDETELKAKLDNIASNSEKAKRDIDLREAEEKEALSIRLNNACKYLAETTESDITVLENEYREAELMKGKIEVYKNLQSAQKTFEAHKYTADQYEYFLKVARDKPAELLKNIKLPVDGLSIDDGGRVIINERPIKNLSTSESIRLCLDIAKATTKNNKLKFICIDKFETLDEEARDEFIAQCENDTEYQYFITQVTAGEMTIKTV